MKKIVLVGGGHGVAELFSALSQSKDWHACAVVSPFDSGGSTGRLRTKFQTPAFGDIRRVVSQSLSGKKKFAADMLEHRLDSGHPIGNLILSFLAKKYGNAQAMQLFAGKQVVLTSHDPADLMIHFAAKKTLVGEHHLDSPPKNYAHERVVSLSLSKEAALNTAVVTWLRTADVIVVGPGSLLGSLLPHFLVPGFADTFERSKAKKIFVAPGRPEFGYRGEDSLQMAERFPVSFDEILENPGKRWEAKKLIAELKQLST